MSDDQQAAPSVDPVLARAGYRRVCGLSILLANAAALLIAVLAAPAWLFPAGLHAEIWRAGGLTLPLAALLTALGPLLGTLAVAAARRNAAAPADAPAPVDASRTAARAIGRAARWPQALLVPALTLPAAYLAWAMRGPGLAPSGDPAVGYTLGGFLLLASFPLLVAERGLHIVPTTHLPEAPRLRALLLLTTLIWFATGLLEIAANIGMPCTTPLVAALAALTAATALELAARALGRLFLPPPETARASGAAASLIARLLAGVSAPGGIGAPMRQHLGIDFSRSWALLYVRAAALPMLGGLLLLAWLLSGVTLVGLDQRAVQERFGAPVAVLPPGLHAGLPYPLGSVRWLEFGPVHAIGLTRAATAIDTTPAEAPAPASADRLWEQAHPAEIELLIASHANGRESFQSVSADLRVLYRVGLSDADALRAAYATVSAEDFVRATAGRVIAAYFADRTLDQVLGADRETMAASLRSALQAELDRAATGLQAVDVVIEAIHPPAGAADAYHNVRAAEINARASVSVEKGAAATIKAQSRQFAFDQTSNADGHAAETVGAAKTALLRFTADQDAARAGGQAFLFERYLAALDAALVKAPKTIIDSRLSAPEAPVLDLRPFAAAPASGPGKEE